MKKDRQFDKKDFEFLTNPENWQLVCSGLPVEAKEVNDHSHLQWLNSNSDSHAQREIMLVLKGCCICSLNSKCYETRPGCLYLFDNFENHDNGYSPAADKLKHLWLSLVGRKIIVRILTVNNQKLKYYGQEYIIEKEHIFPTIQQTWNKLTNPKISVELKRKGLISALCLVFLEIAEIDILGKIHPPMKNYQATIMTTIEEHIKETAGRGLTIDRLAYIAGYSKFHFIRLFKQHTGKRIHTYINEVRIKKVNEMLKKGYMKKEISEELGFSCPAAFANWYKKNISER